MNALLGRVANLVERRPGRALAALLALTLVLAGFASQTTMDTDMTAFAPRSDLTEASDRIADEFGASGVAQASVQVIVDAGPDGDVLSPAGVAAAMRIGEVAAATPEVAAILAQPSSVAPSVVSFALPVAAAAEQFGGLEALDDDTFDMLARAALSEPEAAALTALLSRDFDIEAASARAGLVIVRLADGINGTERSDGELALADALEATSFEGMTVTPFSEAIFVDMLLSGSQAETGRLLLLAFALILGILLLTFRRVSDVLLGLAGLVTTIVWTYGFATLLGPAFLGLTGDMNQISMVIPVLLIALAIDYSIHLTARYREDAGKGDAPARAARGAVISVGGALVLATITTMIGFLTNVFSPMAPLRDFGIFVAIGVASAFVIMVLLVPSARSLLDRRRAAKGTFSPPATGGETRLGRLVGAAGVMAQRHAKVTLSVTLGITMLALVGGSQVSTTFTQNDFVPDDSEIGLLLTNMQDLFGGDLDESTHVLLEGDLADADVANALLAVHGALGDVDHVRSAGGAAQANSPVTVLAAMAADPRAAEQLAALGFDGTSFAAGSDVGTLYDLAAAAGPEQLAGVLSESRTVGLLTISTTAGQDNAIELRNQLVSVLEPVRAAGVDVTVVSDGLVFEEALDALQDSQVRGIAITLLATVLVLCLFFALRNRRPMLGVITMIPSTLVVAWVLGSMWVFGLSFNVMTAMVASLAIGIGVPYGIHVTNRFTEDIARHPDVDVAVFHTLTHTGTALVTCAITTAAGFGVLGFASLVPIQQFGLITALTIVYSLIGAVFVVPACLKLWAQRRPFAGAPAPEDPAIPEPEPEPETATHA